MKSEKQRLHLEKLAKMKRGKPSPLRGRKIPINPDKLESFRKKISKINKEYWAIHKPARKGVEVSLETRIKMSLAKGGNGYSKQRGINNIRYKKFRIGVYERDNYTCKVCNKRGGNLEVHHIKQYARYPELRTDISNGLTVCPKCHSIIDKYRSYIAN